MSEWRVRLSRRLGRWLFRQDVMLCYQVYVRSRLYGGQWTVAEITINCVFLLCFETQHCRRQYVYERRHGNAQPRRLDAQVVTRTTEETEEAASTLEA